LIAYGFSAQARLRTTEQTICKSYRIHRNGCNC